MKKLFLIALVLSLGAALITYNAKTNDDALAADDYNDDMLITVSCTTPDDEAFVPTTVAWAIGAANWTGQTANAPSGLLDETELVADVTGGVNGDTALTPDGEDTGGIPAGFVIFYSELPAMKMTGLQCETFETAIASAIRSGGKDANLDIRVSSPGDSIFPDGIPIDSAAAIGFIGPDLEIEAVTDGSDDDLSSNGQIVYGGSGVNRGKLYMKFDMSGNATQGSQASTITFTKIDLP